MTQEEVAIRVLIFVLLYAFIVAYGFALEDGIKAVSPRFRKLAPGLVWLILIPFVGLLWHAFVVLRLAESIRSEAADLSIDPGDGGRSLGLITTVCLLVVTPIGLISAVMHWRKVDHWTDVLAKARAKKDFLALRTKLLGDVSDSLPGMESSEEQWRQLVGYMPQLQAVCDRLDRLSTDLGQVFRMEVLRTKEFRGANELADTLAARYLSHRFGPNQTLQDVGGDLLGAGNTDAADQLEAAVRLLGADVDPDVILNRLGLEAGKG
jgi:hypothetical protein